MSDLISKNALTKRFKQLQGIDTLANMFISDVIKEIKKQPPVEAAPVVHGEWLKTNVEHQWRCNKCDIIHFIAQYPHGQANFCPNCGADMRKKVE